MEFDFEIAKKMNKQPVPAGGIALSSILGTPGRARMVVRADGYDDLKASVAAYRTLSGKPLRCSVRGKSLMIEIECEDALRTLFEYAKGIGFSSEDALDVAEFCAAPHSFGGAPLQITEIEADKESMHLKVRAQIEEGADTAALFEAFMPALEDYGMGVIKPGAQGSAAEMLPAQTGSAEA